MPETKSILVEVVLPLPLRGPLLYRLQNVPKNPPWGHRVLVPLGSRQVVGCLLGPFSGTDKPNFEMKDVLSLLEEHPILSATELKFLRWMSAYYLTPMGEVLRHLLPARIFQAKALSDTTKERKLKKLPVSDFFSPDKSQEPIRLTDEQVQAAEALRQHLSGSRQPLLLHGITGSGKTEVYLEGVRAVLKNNGQALVLVPEIGLTPQLVGRFQTLGVPVGVYHSGLTPAQRYQVWKDSREGKYAIVIATRSGIFLRTPRLEMIIVDEEHDASYKQDERFCYNGRDLALWRGVEEKILIVLGSATPSLESLYRAHKGKLTRIRLKKRPEGVSFPRLEIIDRKKESAKKCPAPFLSTALFEAMGATLKKKEQVLLFLNRRGFSPSILCPLCGFVPRCHQCDISLTLHRKKENDLHPRLLCHYCDTETKLPPHCLQCLKGTPIPLGFGTERIDRDLAKIFPGARIARLDRDAAQGGQWLQILEKMKKREVDILVGTQMISKGHDYPFVTLVGILDADTILNFPDFRSVEKTYQMITQVSGRAGRGVHPGRVMIQTYAPENPSLLSSVRQEEDAFYERELGQRNDAGYPPHRRLLEIRISGPVVEKVIAAIRQLAQRLKSLPSVETFEILGPAPCPIQKIRQKHRWHLLLKTSHYIKLQPALSRLLDAFSEKDLPSNIRMLVNVDPMEMV